MRVRGWGVSAVVAVLVAAGGVSRAEAALTTPACLAKKLKEWGKPRSYQAVENGEGAAGEAGGPGEVPDEVRREAGEADREGHGGGDRMSVRGERGWHGHGLRHGAPVGA